MRAAARCASCRSFTNSARGTGMPASANIRLAAYSGITPDGSRVPAGSATGVGGAGCGARSEASRASARSARSGDRKNGTPSPRSLPMISGATSLSSPIMANTTGFGGPKSRSAPMIGTILRSLWVGLLSTTASTKLP